MRIIFLIGFLVCTSAYARIEVTDGCGYTVSLNHPARKIISLSPSLTEILAEVGAGSQLIARDRNSDFPENIKKLPVVADYYKVNLEAILALNPDLILLENCSYPHELYKFRQRGIPVYINKVSYLENIPTTINALGILSGHPELAEKQAQLFRQRLQKLRRHDTKNIRVFYELWGSPLLTVNNKTIIGQMITLCGGENIFGTLSSNAPHVSIESVLKNRPQVIISSTYDFKDRLVPLLSMNGMEPKKVYFISPNILERTSSRILIGCEKLCVAISGNFADSTALYIFTPTKRHH